MNACKRPVVRQLGELFVLFIKTGLITFGGGYAIMPVLEREFIGKRGWLTRDEAMEYMSIAQVTPGVIAVNICTFIGNKQCGAAGGIVATLGFILPGVTCISLLSVFLANFAEMEAVKHAFAGIRIAAAALIASTVINMIRGIYRKENGWRKNAVLLLICAFSFALSVVFSASPVFIVLGAALLGLCIFGKGPR